MGQELPQRLYLATSIEATWLQTKTPRPVRVGGAVLDPALLKGGA